MPYDIDRIKNELVIAEITASLKNVVEKKLEELNEKDASPYINGIEGLARYLNIGTTLAQELKNNKEIPSYQRVRSVWFKKAEVDKYINSLRN